MARKIIVVSNFPLNIAKFILFAQNVVTLMTGNALFPNPPVTMAALTALINALIGAEAAAANKTKGAVTDRNNKRAKVEASLRQVEAYVQSIVEQIAPEDADAAINSSGFSAKKPSKHTKVPYSVTRGTVAGTADIDVKALGKTGKVMYCHQFSLNGGTNWTDVTPTVETKTTVTGLPVGTLVSFRYRTLIKGVFGDWSQTMTLLVH